MIISLIYGINASLLSYGYSDLGKSNSGEHIVLFLIVIIIIILGRPTAIKLMYKLLYEPDARVEDYNFTSKLDYNIQENAQPPKIVDFDIIEDDLEKKENIFVLPRIFENNQLDDSDHLK